MQGSIAPRRIKNEFEQIRRNPPTNWKVFMGEEWNKWTIWVTADNLCPFHTIPIQLNVIFPENYPHCIPYFKLEKGSIFFHPNIFSDGEICEQTLKSNDLALSTRERINAIVSVLSVPNPDSPANSAAAKLFKQDPREYSRRALKIFRGFEKK